MEPTVMFRRQSSGCRPTKIDRKLLFYLASKLPCARFTKSTAEFGMDMDTTVWFFV
jgi:hypothetical protein